MRTTLRALVITPFILMLLAATADAKMPFVGKIPNGEVNKCTNCHTQTVPKATWNAFGEDVKDNLVDDEPHWLSVCDLDSDGDGFSNGEELGDPDCAWFFGNPDPGEAGKVSNPGDDTSTPPANPPPEPTPEPGPEPMPEPGPEPMPEPGPEPVVEATPDAPPTDDAISGAETVAPETMGDTVEAPVAPEPTDDDDGCQTSPVHPAYGLLAILCLVGLRRREGLERG